MVGVVSGCGLKGSIWDLIQRSNSKCPKIPKIEVQLDRSDDIFPSLGRE